MGSRPTPMERTVARAWGVRVRARVDGDELLEMVREAMRGLGEPATRHQQRLARQWGLELEWPADGRAAARRLLRFMKCRAWVYSVCRHVAGAYWWRSHAESGLPEKKVVALARQIAALKGLATHQWETEATVGEGTGSEDVWFKMTRRSVASWEYGFVARAVRRQMQAQLVRTMASAARSCKPSARSTVIRVVLAVAAVVVGSILFSVMALGDRL